MLSIPESREKGFRILVKEYQERMYWTIRRIIQDHDDANDVLQNAFIKAYRGIDRFKGESGLYTWLHRIAINESLTFLKRRKRENNFRVSINNGHEISDPHLDAEGTLNQLRKALILLPEKQRIVFNLRYYEEMKYAEMSKLLNTSEGALKASFHHAVKKLKEYLLRSQIS